MKHWQLLICITFTWIGFVCAISFMEAWLKFRAPGVTLPIGLGIGRLIFSTLNKVEWILAIAAIFLIIFGGDYGNKTTLWLLLPVVILIIQSVWWLPAMDSRAELYISGAEDIPPSNLHFYYVGGEVLKVISLIIFGIKLFK